MLKIRVAKWKENATIRKWQQAKAEEERERERENERENKDRKKGFLPYLILKMSTAKCSEFNLVYMMCINVGARNNCNRMSSKRNFPTFSTLWLQEYV